MNQKLIRNELKSTLGLFITYTLIICLVITSFILLYPLYESHQDTIINKLDNVNKYVTKAFNIKTQGMNSTSGYYATIMEFILIIGAIMAITIAFKLILWDTINGYNVFLFTMPISRKKLFINKIITLAIEIIICNVIFSVLSFILLKFVSKNNDLKTLQILQINSSLFLSQITFACIGLFISSLIKKPKSIYPMPYFIVSIFYIISIIERLTNFTLIRYINPFSYFQVIDIIIYGSYRYSFIVASIIIVIFTLSISFYEYEDTEIMEKENIYVKKK